jgi:hypothetical protein
MQAQQIQLVRASFAAVQITVSQPGALFYDNLFAADPSLRDLFHSGIAQQTSGSSMIGSAPSCSTPRHLAALRQLGAPWRLRREGKPLRHRRPAPIRTLEQGLGVAFTDEVRPGLGRSVRRISSTMIEARSNQPSRSASFEQV